MLVETFPLDRLLSEYISSPEKNLRALAKVMFEQKWSYCTHHSLRQDRPLSQLRLIPAVFSLARQLFQWPYQRNIVFEPYSAVFF